jgi:hypothetical protein
MPASSNVPSPEPMEPMFDPLQCSLQLHAHNTISINDGKQGSISTLDRTIYRQLQKTREIRQQNISTVTTQPMHPTNPDWFEQRQLQKHPVVRFIYIKSLLARINVHQTLAISLDGQLSAWTMIESSLISSIHSILSGSHVSPPTVISYINDSTFKLRTANWCLK